jgi:hypothetical protein
MKIKTLHKEYLFKEKIIVKIYIDADGEYSAQTFIIRDNHIVEEGNGYGFSCEKVYDEDSLEKELVIWSADFAK